MKREHGVGPANLPQGSSRALRQAVAAGAAIMVLIGLILLFLLTQATNNRELYERNYAWLFTINVAVASLLLVAVLWVGYRLYLRLRQGKFGSRLLVKLATIFALVGLAPGLLIYVVSYQFVSRSIETWFDVKVEGALEAGLSLGRVTLDAFAGDLTAKSRAAVVQISQRPDSATGLLLERVLDQLGASDVSVWSASGGLLASAGQTRVQLSPDKPSPSQFRSANAEGALSWVDGLEDAAAGLQATAYIKVLAPISSPALGLVPVQRFLMVSRALPSNLVANALAVEGAYREYQERALSREGLKRMYIGTLTLSLFLAVFGAVLLAVILGNQLARPLLVLAEGVSQVASGDLTPKFAMRGKDELGGLTRAFASMTEQLAEARQTVQHSMESVDAARANLQTILDNLTSGVIVLGEQGEIRSSNPGAARILQVPLAEHEGETLANIDGLKEFGRDIQLQFAEFLGQRAESGLDHWQHSFQLGLDTQTSAHGPFDRALTLVARGAELPDNARLLVFDDISEIVSAQRAQAWGEVARRLAHEIKNPLTPIQLSAERLEMKLSGKLPAIEQALLVKSVKTIVDQVDAMKRLVNEFRDYARLPAADLKPVDLNALVLDILQLYDNEAAIVPIRIELDPLCPVVRGDAQQLRQVIHNLLQNAMDASEAALVDPPMDRSVVLRTQWQPSSGRVRLSVLDYGTGFPDHILKRAFEPYVTTKARGTGLGLAVVKKIADEHGSRIDLANRIVDGVVIGAQVSLSLAVDHSAQT
ncbi:MAG: PAS domain-containing sensor histidine kinase [Burkholderiales bacterium RIFCSPLOWO2_12_FULL_61_40]|nr:MAG: PAS domain-containing sensor histidine kinase [Burkholderiales bacterium RIFCSPLOWO2_12_FULL_61_40]